MFEHHPILAAVLLFLAINVVFIPYMLVRAWKLGRFRGKS